MPQPQTPLLFGPWRPDLPEIGTGYTTRIVNARPGTDGWRPVNGAVVDTGYAWPAQVLNMGVARLSNGNLHTTVAAGNRLYQWTPGAGGSALDISRGGADYSLEADTSWAMEIFGNLHLMANGGEPIQSLDLVSGGPTYVDLHVTAPHARYLTVIRDFVVAGVTGTDAANLVLNQVQWGPLGAPDGDWTPSATTQAGLQVLHDMGTVQGITGGEFGTIITDRGVVRQTYVNVPNIFQFDTIARNVGTRWPRTIVQYNRLTYFWGPDGVYASDGATVADIGTKKINRWLLQDFDMTLAHRVRALPDTQRGLVLWAYPGKGHDAAGNCNRILIYDPGLGEFGLQNLESEAMGLTQIGGYTMDAVTWSEVTHPDVNLDAREYQAEDVVVSIVDPAASDIRFLSGQAQAAEIDSPEIQIAPGRRSVLNEVFAIYEGFGHKVMVGTRESRAGAQKWTQRLSPLPDGHVRPRVKGRYHRVRLLPDAGWHSAVGVDLDGRMTSVR